MNSEKIYVVIGMTFIVAGATYIIFRKKINAYVSRKFFSK